MTDEPAEAPPEPIAGRPPKCALYREAYWMICTRCGLQFAADTDTAPACRKMTFTRMRERMLDELAEAERSLNRVLELKGGGMPANPAPARARLSELDAIYRLVEREKAKHDAENAEKKAAGDQGQ
jgi:hypothetical protein